MPDLWLVWFRIGPPAAGLTRNRLSKLCIDTGIIEPLTRDTTAKAFHRAYQVRHEYTGADDVVHTLSASVTKVNDEVITTQVVREDQYKVAEYKLVGRAGAVMSVKAQCRARMLPVDRQAAREWIAKADALFAVIEQELPLHLVRRCVRATLDEAGWPVPGRGSAYFVYEDELEVSERVREFLAAATGIGDVVLVGLDESYRQLPAQAIDVFLLPQITALNTRLCQHVEHDDPEVIEIRQQLEVLRTLHARHERRLETALPLTGEQLSLADRMIADLVRAAVLPPLANR